MALVRESLRWIVATLLLSYFSRATAVNLIIPGTLWCGRGNIAENANQTGVLYEADKCCRDHDRCPRVIRSMETVHGYMNWSPITISHCDCDHKFRKCLKNGQSAVTDTVGNLFFNIIKVKCFKVEGKCKRRMPSRGCVEWMENTERVRIFHPTFYESTYT